MNTGNILSLLRRFVFTRNLTLLRLANFILVTFQHQVLKNSKVIGYPIELVIDTCNICNLHCPLCPTGQGKNERLKQPLSLEKFRKIIDELGKYLYQVDLHNWGEPLLNEAIFEIISYAHSRNIRVTVSSNLNYFDETMAAKMIDSRLDGLIISLSGLDQNTYGKYHIGGSFEKVLSGTKLLLELKNRKKSKTPAITWRFLVMHHNEAQIPRARQIVREMGINLELMPIHGDMGQDLFWPLKKKFEAAAEWLPQSAEYKFEGMKPCSFLWVQAVINGDGSVAPCCAVYPSKYDFGNMFTEGGFMEIWNNKNYQTARRIIRKKHAASGEESSCICACCLKTSKLE